MWSSARANAVPKCCRLEHRRLPRRQIPDVLRANRDVSDVGEYDGLVHVVSHGIPS